MIIGFLDKRQINWSLHSKLLQLFTDNCNKREQESQVFSQYLSLKLLRLDRTDTTLQNTGVVNGVQIIFHLILGSKVASQS